MVIRKTAVMPNLTARSIGILALVPAFFMTSTAFSAVIVDNGTLNIDSTTAPVDYLVRNNGVLNVNAATTRSITIATGSTLAINGGNINANDGEDGITVNGSRANINQATVTSDAIALLVNREPGSTQGSEVTATHSVFIGSVAGAATTAFSVLELVGSEVTGTGAGSAGLNVNGGSVRALAGTRISGDAAGVLMNLDSDNIASGSLVLDNAFVEGRSGSAIVVDQGIDASIQVLNNSTLQAADGNLLNVLGASNADLLVVGSVMDGNVNVEDNSTANLILEGARWTGDFNVGSGSVGNLVLQEQSNFTGRLDKVSNVSISQSEWTMTGNDTIGALTLADGTVRFGAVNAPGTYYQLQLESLDGSGTFIMKGDFTTGERDFLNITGSANGSFGLEVSASGKDAVSPQQLALVHANSGGAIFSLVGGPVDLGTWSYSLASANNASGGTDWYLDPSSKTISPGAQSVVALFKTAPTISYGELTSLEKRMDDLQSDVDLQGFWIRPFNNRYDVADVSGIGYRQRQQGLSLGIDTRLGDSLWRVGVLAGYSQADIDLDRGTSATVDSVFAGPYFNWQNPDNDIYVNGVLKFNRFRNKSTVNLSDNTRTKVNYDNSGVSALAEIGQNIKLGNNAFLKPFAQLTAAVIEGANYDFDNGMAADGDRTRSLRGKLGVATGRHFNVGKSTALQPYAHVALLHEFASNDTVKVNGNELNADLSGSGVEVGTGIAATLSENTRLDVGFDYAKGKNFEAPFAFNVGFSYKF